MFIRYLFPPLTLFLLLAPLFSAHAATVVWDSDQSGDWSDGSKWDTGAPPQPGDDVVIDRPNVDLTVTISGGIQEVRVLDCQESLHVIAGALTVTDIAEVFNDFRLNSAAQL
ncbi:hypothetical protein MRY87_11375, partial [bacterium]|nr:hypothetical protein [bacterium]